MNTNNTTELAFSPFKKIPRLFRQMTITEKIDGTNASIYITKTTDFSTKTTDEERCHLSWDQQKIIAIIGDLTIRAGSRTRWITPDKDNFGFAQWVMDNADDLVKLGEGHHFGEWWGSGIQRGYGLQERRFSLFNTHRWTPHDQPTYAIPNPDPKAVPKFTEHPPACCHVVPVLFKGSFCNAEVEFTLDKLEELGSKAAAGFMKPEGVIVYHDAANQYFKVLLENDHEPKGEMKI